MSTPTEAWWNDLKDFALFSQIRLQGIKLIGMNDLNMPKALVNGTK